MGGERNLFLKCGRLEHTLAGGREGLGLETSDQARRTHLPLRRKQGAPAHALSFQWSHRQGHPERTRHVWDGRGGDARKPPALIARRTSLVGMKTVLLAGLHFFL